MLKFTKRNGEENAMGEAGKKRMDKKEKQVDNIVLKKQKFVEWINHKKKELNFKKTDLMISTGISSTTIDNYFSGDSYPNKEYLQKIVDFVYDLSEFEGFIRIPNKEFASLFYKLMGEFSYRVNQEMLSKVVGISQSNISKLQNGKFIPTTAMQKLILEYFYEMTLDAQGEFLSEHEEIGNTLFDYLKRYLAQREWVRCCGRGDGRRRWKIERGSAGEKEFEELLKDGYLCGPERMLYNWHVEQIFSQEEIEMVSELEEYCKINIFLFKQYPDKIQNIILENIRAFCDNYYYLSEESEYFYGFAQEKRFMEKFRRLPADCQWDIIDILEDKLKEPLEYWSNREEKEFFLQMTDLQKMIVMTSESEELAEYYNSTAVSFDSMKVKGPVELGVPTSNSTRFARCCSALLEYDVIDEITYKLGFNSKEWYLWSLMIKAGFYDVDYEAAFDELPGEEFE